MKGRGPFYFSRTENPLLGLAGVWDEFTDGDTVLYTYSIITRAATPRMSRYHHRMPVIIEKEDFGQWLSAETSVRAALDLLEAGGEKNLDVYPVSTLVNNVRNDSPENINRLTIDD